MELDAECRGWGMGSFCELGSHDDHRRHLVHPHDFCRCDGLCEPLDEAYSLIFPSISVFKSINVSSQASPIPSKTCSLLRVRKNSWSFFSPFMYSVSCRWKIIIALWASWFVSGLLGYSGICALELLYN